MVPRKVAQPDSWTHNDNSLHLHWNSRQPPDADRADKPINRGVVEPNATMTTGGPERIEQTRAAAPMDTDGPIAAVELLQRVAVGGERQDPGA